MTRRQAGDFSEAWVDNRKSCDFSPSPKRYQPLPPSARARMPLAPTKSAGVSYSPGGGSGGGGGGGGSGRPLQMHPYPLQPTHGGLGRRAVTQLDFGRAQRSGANHFDRVMPAAAAARLMQQQQQHYHHGGSQYLYRRGNAGAAAAAAGGGGVGEGLLPPGPYSSDSEFTAQRARRPHVLLHKEQPVLTRIRRPSQVRERVEFDWLFFCPVNFD